MGWKGLYMKIVLDVMGGDKDLCEFVKGALMAKKEYGEEIILVGVEVVLAILVDVVLVV